MVGEKIVKIRSAEPLYTIVEETLNAASEPMTCATLTDVGAVRAAACARFGDDVREATNRLSDLLGFMWRRGVLTRYSAPYNQGSLARYAYSIKRAEPEEPVEIPLSPPTRHTATRSSAPAGDRPSLVVTETENGVQIEFQHFTVTVRAKQP